jgi:hypothetical protein
LWYLGIVTHVSRGEARTIGRNIGLLVAAGVAARLATVWVWPAVIRPVGSTPSAAP